MFYKEALTFLIANARELNLPYEEYMAKLNKIDQDQMALDGPSYGQAYGESYGGGEFYGSNAIQQEFNKDYKGEMVDFSKYSNKNAQKPAKEVNQFMKFDQDQSPDELLP